jgi:hypothetical protein
VLNMLILHKCLLVHTLGTVHQLTCLCGPCCVSSALRTAAQLLFTLQLQLQLRSQLLVCTLLNAPADTVYLFLCVFCAAHRRRGCCSRCSCGCAASAASWATFTPGMHASATSWRWRRCANDSS